MVHGSRNTSDSNGSVKWTPEAAFDPKEHAGSRKLLFINYFSVDRTRTSHNPDRKTVSAHVQRRIRQTKRIDAGIKLKPAAVSKMLFRYRSRDITEDEAGPSPTQRSPFGNRNVPLGRDVGRRPSPAQTAFNLDDLRSDPSSRQTLEDQLEKALILLERVLLQPPKVCKPLLGTGVLDKVMPGGISKLKLANNVFKFFLGTFTPRIFPVPIEAKRHNSWVVQSVLASPELLLAILAIGAASFLALTRNPRTTSSGLADTEDSYGTISLHDAIAYKIIAVKHLRSAVEDNTALRPGILLYCIMCLMVTEIVNGDTNAMKIHTNALRQLMQSRGSYESLPSHVIETLLSSCYISSTITRDPPIPPPLQEATLTTGQGDVTLASIFNTNPCLGQLGQAFFDPEIKKILGPQLVSVFRDMSIFISWREHYHLSRSHPNPEEIDFFHALQWRSHFAALNFPFEPQHAQNNMQEPCRTALLIFWNTSNQVNRPGSVLYHTLAAQLSGVLEGSVLQSLWEKSRGVLTWMLLLGAFITEGQPERRWFVMNITSGFRNTSVSSWARMEPIFLRFLYLERIHQKAFEQIWNEAIEMLRHSA